MSEWIYFRRLVIISSIIAIPDYILSFGGCDTYLLNIEPLLIYFYIIIFGLLAAMIAFEVFISMIQKRWRVSITIIALFLCSIFSIDALVSNLQKKTIIEVENVVLAFLNSKGEKNNITVAIEGKSNKAYQLFLSSEDSIESIQLYSAIFPFRRYEYNIKNTDGTTFRLRYYHNQNGNGNIWIH